MKRRIDQASGSIARWRAARRGAPAAVEEPDQRERAQSHAIVQILPELLRARCQWRQGARELLATANTHQTLIRE
jgi:hypothetical protein